MIYDGSRYTADNRAISTLATLIPFMNFKKKQKHFAFLELITFFFVPEMYLDVNVSIDRSVNTVMAKIGYVANVSSKSLLFVQYHWNAQFNFVKKRKHPKMCILFVNSIEVVNRISREDREI